jgi:hypothetical protein
LVTYPISNLSPTLIIHGLNANPNQIPEFYRNGLFYNTPE